MGKTAILIGATGLVGKQVLTLLLDDKEFSKVKVFGRRSVGIEHKKIEEFIVDFDSIDSWKQSITGDVLFSTLGTTIKQAGTKAEQYKIDYTYQFNVAKAASQNGVKQMVLVSSLGANAKSSIFYSKMKGELEEAIKVLNFQNIYIIRPSGLVGDRNEDRAGEKVMIQVTGFMTKVLPFLKKYKPIHAKIVAGAMINILSQKGEPKFRIVENIDLFEIAK